MEPFPRKQLQQEHLFFFLQCAFYSIFLCRRNGFRQEPLNFAVMDFWRFWVVHLWVEDFLELFTTIMVAYIYVLHGSGPIRLRPASRIVYLDIILYSIGGVIGTMHRLYF